MKQISIFFVMLALVLTFSSSCREEGPGAIKELKNDSEKLSYSLGLDIGSNLKRLGVSEIDTAVLYQGLRDSIKGSEPLISKEDATKVLREFSMKVQAKKMAERKGLAEKNQKEGEEFLAKNKKEKGVKTTSSGLQYLVLEEGKGDKPKADDTVKVQYKGTLIDGTEFDSSHKRGKPATFKVNGVIPGWTEAMQLMKVGGKSRLFVPSKLAYGERGAGDKIGPNAVLIFEVELLGVEK